MYPCGFVASDLDLLSPLVLKWPYSIPKDFKWWKGVVCIQQGHPLHTPVVLFQDEMLFCDSCDRGFHMECCNPPLSRMPKGEVFTLSGFSGCLSAVISKLFLHKWPYGAVTQQTVRPRCLIRSFACISMISASLGRFAISGLQYWPYSKACNDGVHSLLGHLADHSHKSHWPCSTSWHEVYLARRRIDPMFFLWIFTCFSRAE